MKNQNFDLGCVDSANLASRIRGERSEERKSWGWRSHESGQEVEREVCTGLCVCARMSVCMCPRTPAALCRCMSVSTCIHVSVHIPVCTPAHVQLVHVPVCAHVSACVCVWGGSVSCCSAVQHLTPHTIRGIPAILGTRPRQFWENGSFWKGWECFLLW